MIVFVSYSSTNRAVVEALVLQLGELGHDVEYDVKFIGAPMTYLGPDGTQYVAVLAGVGGAANTQADVPGFPAKGGTLYVFAL